MIRKILQPFYTAYVSITFLISILVAFPIFGLISLGNNFRSRRIIHSLIQYWSTGWLFIVGMPLKVKGTIPEGRYIVVANHISYLDTLVIFPAVKGYFRPLGKKEITKIPVIGFIYRQVAIMVDRSSAVSRAVSMRLMWRVLKKEGNIVIFPEGTFNETGAPLKDFYNGAFRLALTTQTNIMPLILPDTERRWHYSAWWKIWPGKNRATFLKPVDVQGLGMGDLELIKQKVSTQMAEALIRYQRE